MKRHLDENTWKSSPKVPAPILGLPEGKFRLENRENPRNLTALEGMGGRTSPAVSTMETMQKTELADKTNPIGFSAVTPHHEVGEVPG